MKSLLKEYAIKIFEEIGNYEIKKPIYNIDLNISKGDCEFIDVTFFDNNHNNFTINFYNFYDEAGLEKKYNEFLSYLNDSELTYDKF